jgi:hypothetical protein
MLAVPFPIMRRLSLLIVLALLGTAFAQQPSPPVPQVKLRLTEDLSSSSAKIGQPVSFEVVDPVQIDGKVIIAAGAHASATVTTVKRRGHNGRQGQLVLTVRSVSRVDGNEAILQSASVKQGSGKGEPIFGPCTFPFPADPAGLFRKGYDVMLYKGALLVATIAPDKP